MPRLIWGHSTRAWEAMFARVARAERARELRPLLREVADIYIEVAECGDGQSEALLEVSQVLMDTMTRAEQIEMLSDVLRRVDARDRDDALELICALLPYAKPRRNAPRGEIAGVSLFNTVVRKSKARGRRRRRAFATMPSALPR